MWNQKKQQNPHKTMLIYTENRLAAASRGRVVVKGEQNELRASGVTTFQLQNKYV